MSDQRGLLAADAPGFDLSRLAHVTGVARPVETPGFFQSAWTISQNVAGHDELEQAEQQAAVEKAYDPIIAELKRRGIDDSYTWSLPGGDPWYNEGRIFKGIARAKAIDPSAFKDVPDDPAAFRAKVTTPLAARYAWRHEVERNSGWAGWLTGQFAGGLSDPINLIGMLDGAGEARTVAQAALRDAAVNTRLTAMQMPAQAIEQTALGQDVTPVGEAEQLGMSALIGAGAGAAFKTGGHVVKSAFGRIADRVRANVPPEQRTAQEDAAIATLDRADETIRTSPFTPGAATDTHMAKMDWAIRTLADPPDPDAVETVVPRETSPVPRFSFDDYAQRVGQAESGNVWHRQAEGSSAYGRWQITHDTFIRFSGDGLNSGETAWKNRANPAVQQHVFENLTRHNRAVLARIGAPETNGNLYLLHFAGDRMDHGGAAVLRADPDTPVKDILSAEAIKANPFLKDMSAEELVGWAARKMGEEPHAGPVLRRDQFAEDAAGDAEWRQAQAAVDAETAAETRAADDQRAAAAGELDDIGDPRHWDDPEPVEPIATAQTEWRAAAQRLIADQGGEAQAALYNPEVGPIDVKWGEPGTGPNFAHGYGLSHILAKHPEMAARLDELPELIREMRVISDDGRTIRLASDTHQAGVRLDWDGKKQRWLVTAYEPEAPAASVSSRDAADGRASPDLGVGQDIGVAATGGNAAAPRRAARLLDGGPHFLMERAWEAQRRRGERPEPLWMMRSLGGEQPPGYIKGWSPRSEDVDRMIAESGGRWEKVLVHPEGDGATTPTPDVAGFDHPGDVAAERQADSLEHDIRMLLDTPEGKDMTVQLDDEGKPVKAVDALADADADLDAIERARACLKPPAGGGA